jgi:hypothetical protein
MSIVVAIGVIRGSVEKNQTLVSFGASISKKVGVGTKSNLRSLRFLLFENHIRVIGEWSSWEQRHRRKSRDG